MTHTQLKLQHPTSGSQLGKYRLVATLGEGGMGTVHLALASGLGTFRKLIVIKELRSDVPWKDTSLAMFMDEAYLASRLEHPNLLQTFEAGEDQGRYFLAMEYLDGQPLSALVDRCRKKRNTRPLSLDLHLFLLCEVLNGLQHAHQLCDYDGKLLNIVHRDISPQNVFVTYHGQVKIVDFGVARADGPRHQTSPGVFKGKFAYAAPEQLLGRPVDGRCDLFSVGIMLWEALAGENLCDRTPTPEAFQQRTTGGDPNIRQVRPDVDPRLAEICDRALALDPNQRFASAEAFRRELQAYLQAQVQPTALPERVDGEQLGELMREVFATERAVMHQVIERAVSGAGATHSTIQALPIHVSELEALRAKKARARQTQHTREARTPREPRVPREARESREPESHVRSNAKLRAEANAMRPARPAWLNAVALAGLGAVVFAATFEVSRSFAGPQLLGAPQVTTQLSPATRAPSPTALAPSTSNGPGAQSPQGTQGALMAPAALNPASTPRGPSSAGLVAPTGSPSTPRTAAATIAGAPSSPLPQRPRSKPARPVRAAAPTRAVAPRPAAERPRTLEPPTRPAPGPQRTAAAPTKPEDVRMGSDLRALRNRAAGWVDSEDPYR